MAREAGQALGGFVVRMARPGANCVLNAAAFIGVTSESCCIVAAESAERLVLPKREFRARFAWACASVRHEGIAPRVGAHGRLGLAPVRCGRCCCSDRELQSVLMPLQLALGCCWLVSKWCGDRRARLLTQLQQRARATIWHGRETLIFIAMTRYSLHESLAQ